MHQNSFTFSISTTIDTNAAAHTPAPRVDAQLPLGNCRIIHTRFGLPIALARLADGRIVASAAAPLTLIEERTAALARASARVVLALADGGRVGLQVAVARMSVTYALAANGDVLDRVEVAARHVRIDEARIGARAERHEIGEERVDLAEAQSHEARARMIDQCRRRSVDARSIVDQRRVYFAVLERL